MDQGRARRNGQIPQKNFAPSRSRSPPPLPAGLGAPGRASAPRQGEGGGCGGQSQPGPRRPATAVPSLPTRVPKQTGNPLLCWRVTVSPANEVRERGIPALAAARGVSLNPSFAASGKARGGAFGERPQDPEKELVVRAARRASGGSWRRGGVPGSERGPRPWQQVGQESLRACVGMEWKLERFASRRVRTEEQMVWENIMETFAKGVKRNRNKSLQKGSKESNVADTKYSNFKSNIVKRQTAEMPIASSPITTRGQQVSTGNCAAHSFKEDHSLDDLTNASGLEVKRTQEEVTMILGSPGDQFLKTCAVANLRRNYAVLRCWESSNIQWRNSQKNVALKSQRCLTRLPSALKELWNVTGKMQICERPTCLWKGCRDGIHREESVHRQSFSDMKHLVFQPEVKIHLTGLRDDYYLNILDWNSKGLLALALGSAVHIWNGESHDGMGSIDLSPWSNYISSVSWTKEGGCLAIGTSEGEVQLWDVETKKMLRNMVGHISVVGALSWNHFVLSSGSRLGKIHHYDTRAAQHHIGTLCHKQSICALKWSPDGKLLSSGCIDGLLNIWPYDPGAKSCQPLKALHHPTAVKAMNWCPWQSEILAIGGGMKDGHLHVWDINTENSTQTPCTKSQICSLIWLPNTKEIATGHGIPEHEVTLWSYPFLTQSGGFSGHRGRVLHLALSPDQSKIFSVAADGTACVWKCF
ncbi:cell division cycle protein 20 homolog B [Petaurus breviceps papuanus]|uniref:cell division cycle protein 20 homolog B n=1 Tax=Petaurus breviceps papuanus TaxID=3040969 RepID=UPI0036DB8520